MGTQMKSWFLETPGMTEAQWDDDKAMLSWMGQHNQMLEQKVVDFTKHCVTQERTTTHGIPSSRRLKSTRDRDWRLSILTRVASLMLCRGHMGIRHQGSGVWVCVIGRREEERMLLER